MPKLRHSSLFSGIGGFDLGLGQAGIETVMVCENDLAALLARKLGLSFNPAALSETPTH
jgi:site-specific DNA-cytosine methylase